VTSISVCSAQLKIPLFSHLSEPSPQQAQQQSPADQKISALDLLESIHAAVDMDVGGTHSSDDDEEEEDEDLEVSFFDRLDAFY
jgi:hypothetical protein